MLLVTLPVLTVICLHGPLPHLPKVDWLILPFTARTWPNAQHCTVLKDKSCWYWKQGTWLYIYALSHRYAWLMEQTGLLGWCGLSLARGRGGAFSSPGMHLQGHIFPGERRITQCTHDTKTALQSHQLTERLPDS